MIVIAIAIAIVFVLDSDGDGESDCYCGFLWSDRHFFVDIISLDANYQRSATD